MKEKDNLSQLNESYLTGITPSPNRTRHQILDHSYLKSETAAASPGINEKHANTFDEYHFAKLGLKERLSTPSRFKLGMYRKNLVLDPPRRISESLKHPRRTISGEKTSRKKNILIERF